MKKKKPTMNAGKKLPRLLKGLFIMNLSILFMLVFSGQIIASSPYAEVKKLNLHFENATLEEVISEIEKQSKFEFFYNHELLEQNQRKVDLDIEKKTIYEVLEQLFDSRKVDYTIDDKHVIIVPIEEANESASESPMSQTPQQVEITGTVSDAESGEPLPGVNIVIQGTNAGTISNDRGKYTIETSPDATLVFSFVGYRRKEVAVNNRTTINVQMEKDMGEVEEVVVIGYGTQQKENLVGSVDQVDAGTLEEQPVSDVTEALQGTMANLTIQKTNYEVGSEDMNLNIRGVSTMNNNSPLIVVDGVTGADMSQLNPSDIENVSILKDAGSAAIYGSRSANGVILITTKDGKKNMEPEITINAQTGIQNPKILRDPVKGYENAILRNQANVNAGGSPVYKPREIRKMKEKGDVDYFLNTIMKNAMQQRYDFSLSGGGKTSTYRISMGYRGQESNYVGPDYGSKKYNVRVNLNNDFEQFSLNTKLAYTRNDIKNHTSATWALLADATRVPPYYNNSLQDDEGRYLLNDVLSEFNPLGVLEEGGATKSDNNYITGNITAKYNLMKGLKLKGVFGGYLRADHSVLKEKQVYYYSSPEATEYSGTSGNERRTNDDNYYELFLNPQITLDFDRTFNGAHDVKALVGASNESFTSKGNGIRMIYTDPDLNISTSETEIESETYSTPQETTERSLYSVFGRAGYTYAGKYLFEFNFRYDGSSKFAENYRWGFFPSGSFGWRLSEENFMSAYKDKIGSLKLRTSYGLLGNQSVDDYQYQTTYFTYSNAYGFNNNAVSGTGFNFGNKQLTWETTRTFNVGLDAAFFDNQLSVTFDYFNKLTSDILLTPVVPGTFGGGLADYNAGEMRNTGWEFTMTYQSRGDNFNHQVNFNISDSKNEVVKFRGEEEINSSGELQTIIREGLALNSYYGYKTDGYFQNQNEVQNDPKPVGATVKPGDIRYKDKNGDNVIDEKDRYVLGNGFPRYTFGIDYQLEWNNFDFSTLIQGVGKRDMFLRGELVEPFHANYSYTMYDHQLDYWTPVNTDAEYPRLAAPGSASNTNNYRKSSDLYIFDAAYVRLKNLQLGYTLPKPLTQKIGVEKFRVYVNARNLYTISNIPFINPESTEFDSNMGVGGANSGRSYPVLRYYGFGLDIKF